jgi:hypothetical protein
MPRQTSARWASPLALLAMIMGISGAHATPAIPMIMRWAGRSLQNVAYATSTAGR